MNTSEQVERLLDEQEASVFLGAKPATLRKSRCTNTLFGLLPPAHLKLGRTIRYKYSDLMNWIQTQPSH